LFYTFFVTLFVLVRQIKLAISQLLGVRKYTVSYHTWCCWWPLMYLALRALLPSTNPLLAAAAAAAGGP